MPTDRATQIERLLRDGALRSRLPDSYWDDLLHEWIALRFGWSIPRVPVCANHVAPFRFVADLFFERVRHALVFASRNSGKTLDIALLFAALMASTPGMEIGHVGAVQFQSGKAFDYVGRHFDAAGINVPKRSAPLGKGGIYGLDNGSSITIYTGTVAGCQAGHPVLSGFDEVRHSTPPVLEEWKSMVRSSDEREGQTILTSSRGAVGDLMDVCLENAEREHRTVYSWCVFEVAARCTANDCDGCKQYVAFDRLGEERTFESVCKGKMRASRGFMPKQDILDKFVGMSFETFNSQWLCETPEQIGAYFGFHEHIHCLNSSKTSWRPHRQGHQRWWDFGVSDPNSILFVQFAGEDMIVVDMLEDKDGDTARVTAPLVIERSKQYGKVLDEHGDPDGMARTNVGDGTPTIIELSNEFDISINPVPKRYMSHATRHKAVEDRLRPRGTGPLKGKPRLYVWTETPGGKQFAKNMMTVRRKIRDGVPYGEEPDLTPGSASKRAFHSCSALEYGIVNNDIVGGL